MMTPLVKKALQTSKNAMDNSYHGNVSIKNDISNLMHDIASDKIEKDAVLGILSRILKNSEAGAEHVKEAQGWLESVMDSAQ